MPEIEPVDRSLKSLTGLHLWHAPMSSCSQRVRIALAETGQDFQSHLVNLEQDEHATPAYMAIHPDGVVPALVDDGRVFIESIDIIRHVAGDLSPEEDLLQMADAAQADLKLLTFEYLFRSKPAASPDKAAAFQANHGNEALRQFRRDFAAGFEPDRLNAAALRTRACFDRLDARLADGRAFLGGEAFSLNDVAWMPNVHRFDLMGWPFELTPNLQRWFRRVAARPSFREALLNWQPEAVADAFADYTARRHAEGRDIRALPCFRTAGAVA